LLIDDFSIMWTVFRLFLKQFFCTHQWVAREVRRYSVSPWDKQQEGEVAMAFLRCKKCGAEFHRIADPSQGER
jgi:predicted Zn-ribbon and HTH transcriptional regulator